MNRQEEVKKDIKKYSSIEAITKTEGGQILVDSLQRDVVSSIDELCSKYKTASHIELIASCARLGERLALLRSINRAPKNKKSAREALEFLLSEEN
jgi:hypothetical protein